MDVVKFPGFRYHEDGRTVILHSPDQLAGLSDGWFESPGEATAAAAARQADADAKAAEAKAKADAKAEKSAKVDKKSPDTPAA